MAITPRSKGLGNIGSIVNRQRLAAPTRPAPKPAPKPVAKMPVPKPVAAKANPFAGGKTTTVAQRQAMSPFNSSAKPVNKFDPMSKQMPQPQVSPGPMTPPQPFNPQPTPQPRSFLDILSPRQAPPNMTPDQQRAYNWQNRMTADYDPVRDEEAMRIMNDYYNQNPGSRPGFGNPFTMPSPGGPLNQVTPMPGSSSGIVDLGNGMSIVPDFGGNTGDFANPGAIDYDFGRGEIINQYGLPGDPNQPVNTPGGGIFGGNLPNMVGNAVGGMFGNMFGGQSPNQMSTIGYNPMTGNYGEDQPTVPTDYDQLEGSGFNTNSSGSLFGGGGFAGK